jgi:hypothetical protein
MNDHFGDKTGGFYIEEDLYTHKDDIIPEKRYLHRQTKEEWEREYRSVRKSIKELGVENRDIQLYHIQLMDYNCAGCSSGVTNVFVEDIDQFAQQYLRLEDDEERVERFLRSKAGEMVTDYYSDSPELNIVQKVAVTELGHDIRWRRDQTIGVPNGFGWPSDYFFEVLRFDIRWIRYKNQILKLVKPSGEGLCEISSFEKGQYCKINVYGNPFWRYFCEPDTPHTSKSVESYRLTLLEAYVWQVVERFETEEELARDQKRVWLSKRQIARAFADVPGDAG